MGRAGTNAPGRLEQAALELYGERGFDQTNVAASPSGPGSRTHVLPYFADKADVLSGAQRPRCRRSTSATIARAPAPAKPKRDHRAWTPRGAA